MTEQENPGPEISPINAASTARESAMNEAADILGLVESELTTIETYRREALMDARAQVIRERGRESTPFDRREISARILAEFKRLKRERRLD